MKDWIPFFQSLIWPTFFGVILVLFRGLFRDVLAVVKKRIGEGAGFNIGPKGFGMEASQIPAENESELTTVARVIAMPKEQEPEDVGRAKDEIARYVADYAVPASVAVQEAVRLSAYVIKDSDPKSPLSHLAWVGVLEGGNPKTAEWDGLANPDVYRNVPISVIEQQLLKNTVNYRRAVHTLNRAITTLGTKEEALKSHGFLAALEQWLPLHEQLKERFKHLKSTPQLKLLKSTNFNTYFDDPNCPDSVLEAAVENA